MGWTYLPCRNITRVTKIEARAKMSSDSVSICCIMPTPRVCSVTFRLHANKGTTFVSLYRLSRPWTLPTFFEKVHFSSMIHFDSENAQIEEREEPSYLFEFNFTA